MKYRILTLLMGAAFMLSPSEASAQCLSNGVPCGQNQSATAGAPTPTTGNLQMGSDGTNAQPILTDTNGRSIDVIYSLPSLPTGGNTIGSIANTGFNINGQLPAFAATPTFNLGTLNGAALDTTVNGLFKSGQNIGNTSFGISGTLPAFAATPTFNVGTTNGLALDTTVGTLFKSGQSIGNTTFGATQSGTWNVGLNAGANAIGTVGVTALPALPAGSNAIGTVGVTALPALPAGTNIIGQTNVANVFVETSTALAASGTFTGTSRDAGPSGSPMAYGFFTCFTFANVAGTLTMSGSNNNTTFYTIQNQAMTANAPLTTTSRIVFRYMRCAVTNSTTAQSTFVLNSQFGD